MRSFPEKIIFKYEWRTYQHSVLSELDQHLENRHLHLIAPPGSGKTVLGLEVVLRLNQPTLIIAPTLAIKNQWCERFVELFLQMDEAPDWLSMDVKNPKFMTITTYQSLHSLYKNSRSNHDVQLETAAGSEGLQTDEVLSADHFIADRLRVNKEDLEETLSLIKQVGFKTLVLDEAHHLRSEWWKSLTRFRDSLDEPSIVALTATPPYDVSPSEWDRYMELCGPVDIEISVPELVKEHDLCPHQDYIYFSSPTQEEHRTLHSFRENVKNLGKHLLDNHEFIQMIENHPWISQPDSHIEEILSNPGYFSSLIVFLKQAGSMKWLNLAPIIGAREKSIPSLSLEWTEELLNGALFQDHYTKGYETLLAEIKKELNQMGAIERKKVYLRSSKKLDKLLVNSVSKLKSICDIVAFEFNQLQERLRLVILTDYIRASDLPKSRDDEKPLTRLGVIPIFEELRRKHGERVKLGVLTGSIAILPVSAIHLLEAYSSGLKISCTPLKHDGNYVSIQMDGKHSQLLVRIMTEIFSEGGIHVLVGTTALLGEGWDAPSINAIILASYVGTFMLSNQMRGRAIRVERGNDTKTANIWHLVCADGDHYEPGQDLKTLERRFKSFVGISFQTDSIENGIGRMDLLSPPITERKITALNQKMLEHAQERSDLKERWNRSIMQNSQGRMVEELRTPKEAWPKRFLMTNTITALLIEAILLGICTFWVFVDNLWRVNGEPINIVLFFLLIGVVASCLFALPKSIKALVLLLKHGSVEWSLKEIGHAVLNTLQHLQYIKTDLAQLDIRTERDPNGYVYCWLIGGTTYEATLFLDAMEELSGQIDNPRYLLVRKQKLKFKRQVDYHAVPQMIGKNKEGAEFLHKQWNRKIGKGDLIFTRTMEGRKLLLKARMKSMSAAFLEKKDRISAWR